MRTVVLPKRGVSKHLVRIPMETLRGRVVEGETIEYRYKDERLQLLTDVATQAWDVVNGEIVELKERM